MNGLDSSEQLGFLQAENEKLKEKVVLLEKQVKQSEGRAEAFQQSMFRYQRLMEFYQEQTHRLWLDYVDDVRCDECGRS